MPAVNIKASFTVINTIDGNIDRGWLSPVMPVGIINTRGQTTN